MDIVLVVTGSDEFIEEGAVSAVKGVLFSVGVTEVINLKYQVEILTIILVCVTVYVVLTDHFSALQLCIAVLVNRGSILDTNRN